MEQRMVRYSAVAGLVVSMGFALQTRVTLAEFVWTFWLVGLCSSYLAVTRVGLHLVGSRHGIAARLPRLPHLSDAKLLWAAAGIAVAACLFLGYGLTMLFGFYGIFVSVWVNLEPASLFGRNGFINSDFWTPVFHLSRQYWPLLVGQLIAELPLLLRAPVEGGALQSTSRELTKLHVMVLFLPFIALGAWMLAGERYEALAVAALLVVKALFDAKSPKGREANAAEGAGVEAAMETRG